MSSEVLGIPELARELAAKISLECWQPRVYVKIYLFFVAIWLVKDYIKLDFPNNYLWAEIFINYEGGFMRRGLLGQLFYYAAPWINIRFLGLLACTAAFLCFLKMSYARFSRTFDRLTVITIFITPAYFLFFVKDYGAFLRKDQFLNLLILFTVIASANCLRQRENGLIAPTCAFIACFCAAFFIHEAAVFYFALPAWLLGLVWARREKTAIWFVLMAALFLSAGYTAIKWPGSEHHAEIIGNIWQGFYPDFTGQGALTYLGMPIGELMAETAQYQQNAVILRSSIWGLFLALLPMAWICAAYRPLRGLRGNAPFMMRFFLPFAALCPWALPVFACDFGRHIALASINYLLILWAIVHILQLPRQPWLSDFLAKINNDAKTRILALLTVALYGTSWTLMPWVEVGHSFVLLAGVPDFLVYLLS